MFRRDYLRLMVPMTLVIVAGLAGPALGLEARWAAVVVVATGVVAALWVMGLLLGRGRRIRRVYELAQRLLAESRTAAQADTATGPLAESVDESPDELSLLRTQLIQLGARLVGQVKDAAKKSRNLEALIDGLDEPVFATGKNDAVLLCNRRAEELIAAGGLKPGSLIGRNVRELFTRHELLQMHESAKNGQTVRGQLPLVTPEGVRIFQVSAAPLPAAWGDGVFGAVLALRDVTELANAVQMQTDFVANASHELRTPVTAIRGATETLLDGAIEDPEMAPRLLAMINDHAQRLQDLIRDLMDLSRLESPDLPLRPEPIDLAGFQAKLAPVFDQAVRQRKLAITFELDPALEGFETDAKLLQLIVRNLIDNATKYAFEETTIRVQATLVEPDAQGRRVARFAVSDRGVGIPLDQQERVFERFYQVDAARTGSPSQRGTGLGLAIVKHASRVLAGTVGLESIWQRGTTVWLQIPDLGGAAGGPATREPPSAS